MSNKEIERTCNRDGVVWYIPEGADKVKVPKRRLETFGAQARAFGDRMAPGNKRGAGELQLANLQSQQERTRQVVHSYNHCPACGSASFTQRTVKV